MEKDLFYDRIKEEVLKGDIEYLYIGDFNLDMRAKLLVNMFEKAPIVDDTVPDFDRLYNISKKIIEKNESINYWFGRRIDTNLSEDYILISVFDEYTKPKTLENIINKIRNYKFYKTIKS